MIYIFFWGVLGNEKNNLSYIINSIYLTDFWKNFINKQVKTTSYARLDSRVSPRMPALGLGFFRSGHRVVIESWTVVIAYASWEDHSAGKEKHYIA